MYLEIHSPLLDASVKALVPILGITRQNPPTVEQVLRLVIAELETTGACY